MNRWLALVSRIGTTVVAFGLALLLISVIPPGGSTDTGGFNEPVAPRIFLTTFDHVMTPQQTASFSVNSDSSVDISVLDVSTTTLYDWITSIYGMNVFRNNLTYLESFLRDFPQSVAYSQRSTSAFRFQYVPTDVSNITLVISNPGPAVATIHSRTFISHQVAPAARVGSFADLSMSIGLILAVPWIANLYWTRARKSGPGTSMHI